jgi:hypothetical protein
MLERMQPRTFAAAALFALVGVLNAVQLRAPADKRQFEFEQYPAKIYDGPIHMPTGLHKDDQGDWRDALEKWVAPPEVTFAGEYYLAVHSCGAMCRYYQLFNVRTGKEISQIDQFASAEEPPKTTDGHPCWTDLYSRPNSRLLIAEYNLDLDDADKPQVCRQQYFVLENGKLRAISRIFSFCTEENEARQ